MTIRNMEYSKTVFLPKTSFSMKGELSKKEPGIVEFWDEERVHEKMNEKRKNSGRYLLHDGPPYANGHIHIGHALNKILKDMAVKSKIMAGHYSPYVPGWDCHGLPIEQQLLKELKMGKRHVKDIVSFRKQARRFAAKFIEIQKKEFKRLGVLGDWDNPYATMSSHYEATVIRVFNELFEKGYIFRNKKTIYWCPTCETALADAEVEYRDKTSPSIYVKFGLTQFPERLPPDCNAGLQLVVWTTTPWTLPANMAAAVKEDDDYRFLKTGGEILIVADKLAGAFVDETAIPAEKLGVIKGKDLVGLKYRHCLAEKMPAGKNPERSVISADFVEMERGTGIVHIAPGHGEEDFYVGKKKNLEVFCPVDQSGVFTGEAGEFENLKVFDANEKIIAALNESGALIVSKSISHSYPHCWRCKKPIIFRATHQWFLGIDRNGLRETLLREAGKVRWIPSMGLERISGMIKQRPDWCLSRQRYWGTPVPVLYCEDCGSPQKNRELAARVEERAEREGSDFWFSDPPEKIIPEGYKCECGCAKFRKETDILDVWLDSGVSWLAVVKDGPLGEGMYPCDLYLEGSDQHRGWFQTSLVPSVALNGTAPYREVLTHGFVLDEKGRAMHKSMGNVVAPQEIYSKYGAEILRLWTALGDYSDDVRISDKLLGGPIDMYRKIRNTFRYMLGNLNGFDPSRDRVADEKMPEMEKHMRHRLNNLVRKTRAHYDAHEYRQAMRKMADFCILDLSAFYFDAVKDCLYTLGENDVERRAAQTFLHDLILVLVPMLAPVLSFTCEETWRVAREEIDSSLPESVFYAGLPDDKPGWNDEKTEKKWARVRGVREKALKPIEDLRKKGEVGSSLEAKVIFETSDRGELDFFRSVGDMWPKILIVSEYEIRDGGPAQSFSVGAVRAGGEKCPRCWRRTKDIGADGAHPLVCARCAAVLKKKNGNGSNE